MKFNVEYACGHKGEVSLFGPMEDRLRKIEWIEQQDCPNCARIKRQREYAEESKKCKDKNEQANFPKLTGSEKQIAWAETLRCKLLENPTQTFQMDLFASYEGSPMKKWMEENIEKFEACKGAWKDFNDMATSFAMKVIEKETSASWWINHRVNTYYKDPKESITLKTEEIQKYLLQILENVIKSGFKPKFDIFKTGIP